MPRHAKGIRLILMRWKGREPVYYIRDGKKSVSTSCAAHESERANEALAKYLAERFRPDTGQRDLAKIDVAEVLTMYVADLSPTSPSRKLVGYHMKALERYWGDKTLADVKGSTCRGYLDSRMEPGFSISPRKNLPHTKRAVSSSTVRRELKTLRAAINHWHKESPLAAVPKVSLPPEGGRRERYLERSEAAALLRAAHRLKYTHVARFILIGLYTGTRHDAILKLGWNEALSGGHIDIERGIVYRRGKSEKDTSKRRPPCHIGRGILHFVRLWRGRDTDNGISRVVHYQGRSILKMKRAWATVVKAAGLGPDVTPHVLRHTAVTWMLWEGKTIWDVAGIVGADATTIQKVYGHHRIEIEDKRRRA